MKLNYHDGNPIILVSEGTYNNRPAWMNLHVIADGYETILCMVPAMLIGWNLQRTTINGAEAWDDMTAEAISNWKINAHGASFYRAATSGERAYALKQIDGEDENAA